MRSFVPAALAALVLAGCQGTIDNDTERAIVGAGIGAGAAAVTDNNVGAGAAIGAAGGAFCDDFGLC